MRARIIRNSGVSQFFNQVVVTSGETYNADTGVGGALSLPTGDDIICIETPEFTLGSTQSIITVGVLVRPVTNASPSQIDTFEFDLYELGVLPATAPMPI